jgi:hypothetical protein
MNRVKIHAGFCKVLSIFVKAGLIISGNEINLKAEFNVS